MKSSAMMGVLLLLGCASAGTGSSADVGQPADIKQVQLPGSNIDFMPNSPTPLAWHAVTAPTSTTWQYLPIAYSKLGLRITKYDSTTHVIAGERDRSHADFGKKPLTSLLDCGDIAGIPNASRADVTIQVTTGLRGTGTTSAIASVSSATSKANGVSGDASPCAVKGDGIGAQVAAVLQQAVKDGTK